MELGLLQATNAVIFAAAREAGVVVVAKDADFVFLLECHGAPPQLLWVTCGNVSDARLRAIFRAERRRAAALLAAGEPLVEPCGGRCERLPNETLKWTSAKVTEVILVDRQAGFADDQRPQAGEQLLAA